MSSSTPVSYTHLDVYKRQIQIFILNPADLGYLQTIVFILVIAVLVQFIEIFLKKYVVALYNSCLLYTSRCV